MVFCWPYLPLTAFWWYLERNVPDHQGRESPKTWVRQSHVRQFGEHAEAVKDGHLGILTGISLRL